MMKKLAYILIVLLATGFYACSEDNDEGNGSTTVPVDQDEDETTATIDDNYTYKLPVIFHVLYNDEKDATQYIPATRLAAILTHVNEIYRGNVYGLEFGTSEEMKIQFVLATHDESGNKLATPGVEYVKWTGTWPIDPMEFMGNNKDNVKYIWEPNEYINVMLYHFAAETEGETLGISHLPYTLEGVNEIDGLVSLEAAKANMIKKNLSFAYCSSINSKYANKNADGSYYESDRYTNASHKMFEKGVTAQQISRDINVTLAHELGHYLGLLHVFSETAAGEEGSETVDDCEDTDYCEDTPSYNRPEYLRGVAAYLNSIQEGEAVSAKRLMARSNCAGDDYYSANIMDYAYSYGFKISADQKSRTRRVLYDSPLIPGPKKHLRTTRGAVVQPQLVEGIVDLPIRIAKCKH